MLRVKGNVSYKTESTIYVLGAVQKLHNVQRGGGGRRFCYISLRIFEAEGVYHEIVT